MKRTVRLALLLAPAGGSCGRSYRVVRLRHNHEMEGEQISIVAIGFLLSGCGTSSVHPGEKAKINRSGAVRCKTEKALTKLDSYVNKDHDIDRAYRELM